MDPQLLVNELERLSSGQPGAENRVLFLISRTNLVLLTENDTGAADAAASQVIKARLTTIEDRPTALLFSSEDALKTWCGQNGIEPYGMPIHGADMSLALPKDTWIQIDPNTPHVALLSPQQLNALNQPENLGSTELATVDTGFQSPINDATQSSAPALYKPVEEELKPVVPEGPTKKRFFPRSNPTTLFAAPQIEKKEEPTSNTGKSYTSSNLRKVIRPGKPDDSSN